MHENDPLWALRHALVGLAVALLLSVPIAALVGRWAGDALGGDYATRVAVYGVLLLYVLVGAVVLFVRVAQHEKRPLGVQRLMVWLVSLWLWPALFAAAPRRPGD
jgi:4-amino-4-deoxy-L-arabinose transferase-like glycosyltransferase